MANLKTLKPQNTRTKKDQRKIASMGGKASVKSRKKKRMIKEVIEQYLDISAPLKVIDKLSKIYKIDKKSITNKEAMILTQLSKAITKQDTQAFNAILDRTEGKPLQTIENKQDMKIKIQLPENMQEKQSKKDKK
ncbi:MAG: hypothetical protein GY756_09835 [bacterium]|nr:hypothetical protein [bacterium]